MLQYKSKRLTQKKQVLCDLQVFFTLFNCQTPDKKGLLKDKHEAVNELYGAGKDGTHIISEEVQERLKDEIEHDMVCGMMEEPEFGVQRGRHGRLR